MTWRMLEEQQLIGDQPALALLDEVLLQIQRGLVVDEPEAPNLEP